VLAAEWTAAVEAEHGSCGVNHEKLQIIVSAAVTNSVTFGWHAAEAEVSHQLVPLSTCKKTDEQQT
jgi:hypothetical protein